MIRARDALCSLNRSHHMTQPPLNRLCDILAVSAPPVGYKPNNRLTYTKKKTGVASYWHQSPGWCYFSRPPAHQIHDANMCKPRTHQMKKSLKAPSDALHFFSYMAYKHGCNVSPQSYKIYYPPWTRFRLGSTVAMFGHWNRDRPGRDWSQE